MVRRWKEEEGSYVSTTEVIVVSAIASTSAAVMVEVKYVSHFTSEADAGRASVRAVMSNTANVRRGVFFFRERHPTSGKTYSITVTVDTR